jgi:hypothetical protein
VLDGHRRLRACAELGIDEWPRVVSAGLTEEEKIEHICALNLGRRQADTPWSRPSGRTPHGAQVAGPPQAQAFARDRSE